MAVISTPHRRQPPNNRCSPTTEAALVAPRTPPLRPHTPPSTPRTPRSTVGSPLTSHACRRSGDGDLAAGPRRRNSLSEVEILPWLCCMAPAICLITTYSTVLVTSLFFKPAFYIVAAILTFITALWISNLAIFSSLGAYYMRKSTSTDWHAMLENLEEQDPEGTTGVLHIVILPNYQENERMLMNTLENLARSPLAANMMRVVLAMETREGEAGRKKADRLIQQASHLFADIFATYHPENLPGEVAGKSSNTQWAFREALRQYGPILLGCDLSRVFLTVADADTLWHPQYFSALTYQGLTMSPERRSWTIWQSPMLLMRNIASVPAPTRASGHATLIFELSSLVNQRFFPAFAFSSYSMSLALASHPEVDGWDVDVIAEDHHMFCKCYFAALWELAHASKDPFKMNESAPITPQLQVQPVYLPSVSYLVESKDGYWASCWARFQQARRHSQGIVELGYVYLQYVRLMKAVGVKALPARTHAAIISIAVKMHTLHITSTAQCFSIVVGLVTTLLPAVIRWVWAGGLSQLFHAILQNEHAALAGWDTLNWVQQVLASILGQTSLVSIIYSIAVFVIMMDLFEGRYYRTMPQGTPSGKIRGLSSTRAISSVTEGPEGDAECDDDSMHSCAGDATEDSSHRSLTSEQDPMGMDFVQTTTPSWKQRLLLFISVLSDTLGAGYPTIFVYAVIPAVLAACSLIRRGTDFEYIVAIKPE